MAAIPLQPKHSFLRLYLVVLLLLIFVLFTLRSLPSWRLQAQTQAWVDVAHDASHNLFSRPQAANSSTTTSTSISSKTGSKQAKIVETGHHSAHEVASGGPTDASRLSDDDGEPGPQFDLVISHHSADMRLVKKWTDQVRDIPYIKQLGMRLIIYTKGPNVDLDELKRGTGADEVYRLPNVGREGQTMLYHIIKNYDHPSRFTMFSQEKPEWTLEQDGTINFWFKRKLVRDFRPNTGFLAINDWNELCTCGDCGDRGHFPLQIAVHNMFEGEVCHGENWNGLWGQFIVSGKRIQSRPLKAFKWLENLIAAPAGHWIHAETQPDFIKAGYMPGGSVPDNPLFGHTVERSWSMIFSCSYPDRVYSQGLGVVDEGQAHCWDWTLKHDGPYIQPEHWPGFEQIDATWEQEETEHRKAEEQQKLAEMRQQEFNRIHDVAREKAAQVQNTEQSFEQMDLKKQKEHDLNNILSEDDDDDDD